MSPARLLGGLGSLKSISPLIGSMVGFTGGRHATINLEGPSLALMLPLDPDRVDRLLAPLGLGAMVQDGVAFVSLAVEQHVVNQVETYAEFYTTIPAIRLDGSSKEPVFRFDFAVTRDAGATAVWQTLWGHQYRLGSVEWRNNAADGVSLEEGALEVFVGGKRLVGMTMGPRPMTAFVAENHSLSFEFVPCGQTGPKRGRGWMEAYGFAAAWDDRVDALGVGEDLEEFLHEVGYLGTPARWVKYPYMRTRTFIT